MAALPDTDTDPRVALLVEGLGVTLSDRDRRFTLHLPHLAIRPGEAVGLTGASGTGKTLLLQILGLLRRPAPGGRYLLGDGTGGAADMAALWSGGSGAGRARVTAARGNFFGFVPQTGGLMPFLTVRQNVLLTQKISGRPDPAHAEALIARLGLSAVANLRPGRLSIGQRQRTAIARALSHRPRFVIADEPTAALDPETATEAMALLIETAERVDSSVLVSSHDLPLLGRFPLTRYRLVARPDADGRGVTSTLEPLAAEALA